MKIESILAQRINLPQIQLIATWAAEKPENRNELWKLLYSPERQISVNALWVLTHLPKSEYEWLLSKHNELIDMLLQETDTSKKRMLLHILREQEYDMDSLRTDFLDWCLTNINSENEPYAIRAFSIHLAFSMCRHYPELLAELQQHLTMLTLQTLSPGLISARRHALNAIKKALSSSNHSIFERIIL